MWLHMYLNIHTSIAHNYYIYSFCNFFFLLLGTAYAASFVVTIANATDLN